MSLNVKLIGDTQTVMSNPESKNGYFAWPSIARLQNGKLAVVASGYRYAHVCPFGKAVISYSEDEGKTYTRPAPFIDTVLDDRDAGILPFGKSGVIVTSFTDGVSVQRSWNAGKNKFFDAYLDMITEDEEEKYLGSDFRISNDYGVSFGSLYKSPITSPHGPTELSDGTVLWVGQSFINTPEDWATNKVMAYVINTDGTMKYIGTVPDIIHNGKRIASCEPHAIELPCGDILCHIRAESEGLFTIYQSVSHDKGATWSVPKQILEDKGGAPAHLLLHSSGVLISAYSYREAPYGIKVMLSRDNGTTWQTGYYLNKNEYSNDLGYPCTVELNDGTLLTVFYAFSQSGGPAVIMQQKWEIEESNS